MKHSAQHFIQPPLRFLLKSGGGWGTGGVVQKGNVQWEPWPVLPRCDLGPGAARSLVRCSKLPQVVFSRARRTRALQARALPRRRGPSPAAGAPRKTHPCVTGPPGVPPAGSARRSPRGGRHGAALTSSGAGSGSSSQAPRRPPPFCASLAPTAAAPARATATVTFIFLNNSGRKAKAKTAERRAPAERGERGARAGSQRRGLRSRACTRAAGRRSGGNPVHLRRRSEPGANTSAGQGPGRVRAAGGEAHRAPSFARVAYRASAHRGCFPGRPLAPASASGLVAALRGFLASGGGFGLGDQEQASEGSRVGALSQLGSACPQAWACALIPLPSWQHRRFEQPGRDHEVPGSSSWVSGEIKSQWYQGNGGSSFD